MNGDGGGSHLFLFSTYTRCTAHPHIYHDTALPPTLLLSPPLNRLVVAKFYHVPPLHAILHRHYSRAPDRRSGSVHSSSDNIRQRRAFRGAAGERPEECRPRAPALCSACRHRHARPLPSRTRARAIYISGRGGDDRSRLLWSHISLLRSQHRPAETAAPPLSSARWNGARSETRA